MNGLFKVIFDREENDPHFICCYSLGFLLKLIDRTLLKQAEIFLRLFLQIPFDKLIRDYDLASHLKSKGLRKCKMYAYELLRIYRQMNSVSEKQLAQLFNNMDEMEKFCRWEKEQVQSFEKGQHYGKTAVQKERNRMSVDDRTSERSISEVDVESGQRSRSMTTVYQPINFRRERLEKKYFPLSLEGLTQFYESISNINFDENIVQNKGFKKIIQKFARNKKIVQGENLHALFDVNVGSGFLRMKFPEPTLKLRQFSKKDLLQTAIMINRKQPKYRERREVCLQFELDGILVALELQFLEIGNSSSKVIYILASCFDLIQQRPTVVFSSMDPLQYLVFLARVEVELGAERSVKSISLYIQSGDDETAQVTTNQELMKSVLLETLTLLQPVEPSVHLDKSCNISITTQAPSY